MPWERPASVPTGQVWSRFKGREIDGKPARTYQIRDMGEYKEQCLDLMVHHFLRDEPLCDILGNKDTGNEFHSFTVRIKNVEAKRFERTGDINSDPASIATIKSNWEEFVSQDVSLACFVEEDGRPAQLVGFNIVIVKCRDDVDEDFDKVKGDSWKKLLLTLITAEELVDVFETYDVDKYLTSSGLVVLPGHRGQNIGARLFEARKPLAKAMGIAATATVFTATASQVLAQKCGYTLLAELPYHKMLELGVDLTGCPTSSAKVMGTKFKFDN